LSLVFRPWSAENPSFLSWNDQKAGTLENPSFLSWNDQKAGTFCDPNKAKAFICQCFDH